MNHDELFVIKRLLEIACDAFSNWSCEDPPKDVQRVVDRHPEWTIEYHTWNGDPEVVDEGETIHQLTTLTRLVLLKLKEAGKET